MHEKIGVLALGSHEERHGAALPLDTDAKLASHVALEAAKRTGAKFLGVLYSSYELPEIDTGHHQGLEQVMEELRETLLNAKRTLDIAAAVLVNGHGGNDPLRNELDGLQEGLGMRLVFNRTLTELEGPHAATGELSMGAAIGIADPTKLAEHADFKLHPEVGFVGLKRVRERYPWAERHAQEVGEKGIKMDKFLGEKLLECAIADVVNDVCELSEVLTPDFK